MLVKGKLANLIGGMSQQAAPLRLPTQSAAEVNTYPVIVDGNKKRPPTELVAALTPTLRAAAFSHFIHRDLDERYIMTISGGAISVTALDGTPRTVTDNAAGYLNVPLDTSNESFAAVTIADYTFVTNKTISTAIATTPVQPTRLPEALINIIQGNYGKTYSITINGVTVAINSTPLGSDASQAPFVDTVQIGATLMKCLTGVGYAGTRGDINQYGADSKGDDPGQYQGQGTAMTEANGWNVIQTGNTIWIQSLTGVDFAIQVDDGMSGQAMKVIKAQTQNFSDLPLTAPPGYTVSIIGDTGNAAAVYYVEFVPNDPVYWQGGTWQECARPGYPLALDPARMPHVLVRTADGTFTFQQAAWNHRDCGDATTSPDPSFIGHPINDFLFYQNRLGLFSQDNVVLSRTGDFFNFFRTTATEIVDDDPIDVNAATQQVSLFRAATPYQQSQILWSDTTQFAFSGTDILTPKTVNLNVVTPYDSLSASIKPVPTPRRIFFATDRNEFVGLREWYYDVFYRIGQADDDAAHVPTLIPAGAYRMVNSTIEDVLFLASTGDASSLWVYKYAWQGSDKLQSSWTQWTFPGAAVLNMEVIDSTLYLLINRGGASFIEKIRLYPGLTDGGAPLTHLDRRVGSAGIAGSYDAADATTAYTLPYAPLPGSFAAVVQANAATAQYYAPPVVSVAGPVVTLGGDTSGYLLWFGETYTSSYTFSPIYVRDDTQQGALQEGRLQLLKLDLMYQGTGYFRIEVTPNGRGLQIHDFDVFQGGADTLNGGSPLYDGVRTVPIMARSDNVVIRVVNDSVLPSSFVRAEWKGNFVPKARK